MKTDSRNDSDGNLVFSDFVSYDYFVSYESEFCFKLCIILINGKVGFVSKR